MHPATHRANPLIYFPEGSMTCPFSSFALDMLKVAKINDAVIQMDEFAIKRPGQILLPNPYAASGSWISGFNNPFLRNLSGLKL